MSIALDPTTYIPAKAITAPVKGATVLAKKTKTGKKIAEAVDKSTVSKALRPEAGVPKKYYESKIPMGKGCTIQDIMIAIYYLLEQKYETGQSLLVTGGQIMR